MYVVDSFIARFTKAVYFALFIILPLTFSASTDELFEFNKMLVVYAGATLIAFSWIVQSILEKRIIVCKTPFTIPIALFISSQLISTLFSLHQRTSLFGYYTRFNGGFLSTLSYVILFYGFVLFIRRSDLKRMVIALFFGGLGAALYAFPEHFGVSPSCLLLTGQFTVDCWVQDVRSRVFGTFGQPNWLAAYIALLLPVVLASVVSLVSTAKTTLSSRTVKLGLAILFFALLTAVLLYTQSRSGIAGTAVGLLFFSGTALLHTFMQKEGTTRKSRLELFGVLAAGGVLFTLLLIAIGSPFNSRLFGWTRGFFSTAQQQTDQAASENIGGTQLEVGGSESGQIRQVVWKGAWDVFLRYPIFGSGVETFAYSYYKDRPVEHNLLSEWDFLYNKAHNEFLNYLATTGIVGLTTYVLLYGSFVVIPLAWAYGIKRPKEVNHFESLFLLSASSGLVALAISNFFGFSTVMVSMLTFLFPAACVILVSESKPLNKRSHISADQWTVIAISGIVFLFVLLQIYRIWITDTIYAKGKQSNSVDQLQQAYVSLTDAVTRIPEEPVYHDELSLAASKIAFALATQGEATGAAQFVTQAISESDTAISQNPSHVNFYKTRIRVFLYLAQLNPTYYQSAIEAIARAKELSPTDPKLVYNEALIAEALGDNTTYKQRLEEVIALRPTDERARIALGDYYLGQNNIPTAIEHYTYVLQFINPQNDLVIQKIASLSGDVK